jgi:hypothetical protein
MKQYPGGIENIGVGGRHTLNGKKISEAEHKDRMYGVYAMFLPAILGTFTAPIVYTHSNFLKIMMFLGAIWALCGIFAAYLYNNRPNER